MKKYVCFVLLLFGYGVAGVDDRSVKKRQIYREQVVPHAGGKIPDSAFDTDRLLLNRLQKDGFAVPDGVILEQRNPQVHPYTAKASRPVYHVALTSDGRYTPVEGRYLHPFTPSLETTYLYPQVHDEPIRVPSDLPKFPVYRKLTFPNELAIDNTKFYSPPSKLSYRSKHNRGYLPNHSDFKYNAKHYPTGGVSWSQLHQDYGSSRIFTDFDSFFNGLDLDNHFQSITQPPYTPTFLH
ncbi:unnamed protein product [Hermetia illucens]|uniref:Uncharacterized protein n=1 Tax=Hermetia illucens TaxID=343691 RepID=A0A7R8UK99_HERIL|nr:unnamed protein product [Hermetia illucens]